MSIASDFTAAAAALLDLASTALANVSGTNTGDQTLSQVDVFTASGSGGAGGNGFCLVISRG